MKGGGNSNRFFVCDVTSGELPPELRGIPFKTVISMEVIEHLYQPRAFRIVHPQHPRSQRRRPVHRHHAYHGYLKNLTIALANKMDYHLSALWEGGHIKFWSRRTLAILLRERDTIIWSLRAPDAYPYLWRHMVFSARV